MECPRCQEDNLPGLERCLGCGQDLAAEVARPVATVPRVQAANPLRARPPPVAPAGPRRIEDAQLTLFLRVLRAAAWGLLPGLGAGLRGDRRLALLLGGAFLLCGLAWLAMWHVPLQSLAWAAALSVIATACFHEARARVALPGAPGQALALGLALALAMLVQAGVLTASGVVLPRVALGDQPNLPGGHFLVEPVPLEELSVDDLVVIGELPRWWQLAGGSVQVASVLALPGQQVRREGDQVLVDGEPARAHALNPQARVPLVGPEVGQVPAGAVAVYTDPVRLVRAERLAGRVHWRWLPHADRGPVDWPPGAPLAPAPAPAPLEPVR